MSSTPYAIIAGPADVYVAAVGATFPGVDKADSDGSFSTWTKLGFTEGGVKVKHTQTVDQIYADQRTGPQKAIRSAEGLEISFALAQLTLEKYAYALNTATVNSVSATDVITLITSTDAGDAFTLTYNGITTVPFVQGTNMTANAIQTALRTATGDNSLTVTGTTNTGPFTVTYVTAGPLPLTGTGTVDIVTVNVVRTPFQKNVGKYQGLDVGQLAILVRGPSAYMNAFCQYQCPVAVQTDSPEVSFLKDGKAILQTTWAAIEDPNAATASARFGTLVAQTS